ncbi:septum formation initiator family protein [Brooklawnia cerclae]|uniref:Cell division protein FtsB n=1 Tax=Brooklawnia cerclae TaxID=349934 RepID=A0ABX0SIW4_9ACTN|nr:septum formation initiator family protein [Brooklawnia cerclae]NIH57854.1 cell division protein FtsB [Brooklawnia cerclae]
MAARDSSHGGRRASRPGARGTDTPSARTASRPAGRAGQSRTKGAAKLTAGQAPDPGGSTIAPLRRGLRFTQRALILLVVMVLLLVSYATTLRVYFDQQHRIAEARQQIAEHEQSITSLEEEIQRWNDPEYVKIQARERLGWVLPGETGFRVVGADGEPYAGGQEIGSGQLPEGEHAATWWETMWASVRTADDPTADEEADEQANQPVGPDTAASASSDASPDDSSTEGP